MMKDIVVSARHAWVVADQRLNAFLTCIYIYPFVFPELKNGSNIILVGASFHRPVPGLRLNFG
jgi:hypothetical protein